MSAFAFSRRCLLAGLALIGGLEGLAAPADAQEMQKITLFGQPSVNNDSVWMAIENGFFKEEGLDITYRLFPSGTPALQRFQSGQGDIVLAGDLPSMQYFFNSGKKFRLIAAMERDTKGYVAVARKDITKPQDLIGKTVATRVGSTGSWFISEYLTKNGVDPSKVTVRNLDTQLLPTALCNGDIAAFFPEPQRNRAPSGAAPHPEEFDPAGATGDWKDLDGQASCFRVDGRARRGASSRRPVPPQPLLRGFRAWMASKR